MVELAQEHHPAVVADATALPSLMNMDDLEGAVRETARVLEPGGRFCVSVVHPVAAAGPWTGDEFAVADYFNGPVKAWTSDRDGIEMTFYDRPIPGEPARGSASPSPAVPPRARGQAVSAIEIVDYDERWPAEFERLRERLVAALGPLAVRIEHVGSTAVPGLAAKPKLDVDVVVGPDDVEAAIQRLGAIGFEHQGSLGVPGREAFKGPEGGNEYHVYVCAEDSEPLRAHLAFRDHLRTHPQTAAEYAELKRDLAARFVTDRDGYTQAKSEFIRRVLES
jgi:GrpB-like predicted nucleotidyltransferase (UPF0157 family)